MMWAMNFYHRDTSYKSNHCIVMTIWDRNIYYDSNYGTSTMKTPFMIVSMVNTTNIIWRSPVDSVYRGIDDIAVS